MINLLLEGMSGEEGGVEKYIINVYRSMDHSRYRCFFIGYTPKIAYEDELTASGATVFHLTRRGANPFRYFAELKRIFRDYHIDILWSHKSNLAVCESLILAKRAHVPVRIVHAHSTNTLGGPIWEILHRVNKLMIRRWANRYFACSQAASQWFYGKNKSVIMPNAIELERFRFDPDTRKCVRQRLGLEGKYVVGHVGRLCVVKNHAKLFQVFQKVHAINPDAVLLLCGDGELRQEIEEQIRELQLEKYVNLLGNIDNVNEILQGMDVFVLPSLFEGMPFSIVEAQASGLNCVISDAVTREADILHGNRFLSLSE